MLLSDRDIKLELAAGRIGLEPSAPEMVQPSSIDVRLDRYFRLFDNHKYPFIDPAEDQPELTHLIYDGAERAVHPAPRRVRARQHVRAGLPARRHRRAPRGQVVARPPRPAHALHGRLHRSRASPGHVTLELSNVATLPIKLWPGMKIGQLCFFRLSSPTENPYGSGPYGNRYQGQRGPTASRSFQNFHRTDVGTTDAGCRRPLR